MGNKDSKSGIIDTGNDLPYQEPDYDFIKTYKAVTENGKLSLQSHIFKAYFFPEQSKLSDVVYSHIARNCSKLSTNLCDEEVHAKDSLSQCCLINFCTELTSVVNLPNQLTQLYFNVFANGKKEMTKTECLNLLQSCFSTTLKLCSSHKSEVRHQTQELNDETGKNQTQASEIGDSPSLDCDGTFGDVSPELEFLDTVIKCMFSGGDSITESAFNLWISRHCPNLMDSLHHLVSKRLLTDQSNFQSVATSIPSLLTQLYVNKYLLSLGNTWLLSYVLSHDYIPAVKTIGQLTFTPSLFSILDDGWQLLYDTNNQGLSVNRFQYHVFEYKAPTVTLISFESHCYCVAVTEEWRESNGCWGGSQCYIIQIAPEFKIMQSGSDLVFLNWSQRSLPKGIQFGGSGSRNTRLLEIDEDLHKVKHYGIPMPLHRIEVWGCGGDVVKDAQRKQQEWEKKEALKQKDRKLKIDVNDWKNSPDRQLLEMGGVTTEHAER